MKKIPNTTNDRCPCCHRIGGMFMKQKLMWPRGYVWLRACLYCGMAVEPKREAA